VSGLDRPSVAGLHLEPLPREDRFIWYQAMWSLAAHYANHFDERHREDDREEGRRYAVVLALTAAKMLDNLSWGGRVSSARSRRLATFLRQTIEPSAVVLIAGLPRDGTKPSSESGDPRSYRDLLETASHDTRAGATAAHELVKRFLLGKRWSPRTHYTLACHLAAEGQRVKALQQLELAFDPERTAQAELYLLADWAWSDPSLRSLREDPEFSRLTAPYRGSREVVSMKL